MTHIPLQETGEVLIPNLDKIAHLILYAGLSFFLSFWLGLHRRLSRVIPVAILICVIYAILDEGLQAFIPSRNASVTDWIADVLGAIVGTLLYSSLRSIATDRNPDYSKPE